jgi:hypothetical protein
MFGPSFSELSVPLFRGSTNPGIPRFATLSGLLNWMSGSGLILHERPRGLLMVQSIQPRWPTILATTLESA